MTNQPLSKEDVGVATWDAEHAIESYKVRSAFEGLRENLRNLPQERNGIMKRKEVFEALDKWFPVFAEDKEAHP